MLASLMSLPRSKLISYMLSAFPPDAIPVNAKFAKSKGTVIIASYAAVFLNEFCFSMIFLCFLFMISLLTCNVIFINTGYSFGCLFTTYCEPVVIVLYEPCKDVV